MNRIGKSPVLVTSSIAATMVATTSRIHHRRVDSETASDIPPPLTSPSPSQFQFQPPETSPVHDYEDEFSAAAVSNATLPYFRNKGAVPSQQPIGANDNSFSNPSFPKSTSFWGPLHKPMHWKVRIES